MAWRLVSLPHPAEPLPLPLLFAHNKNMYALIAWHSTLGASLVIGPLPAISPQRLAYDPMQARTLCSILGTRPSQTVAGVLFAAQDGSWVSSRFVDPTMHTAFFVPPLATPDMLGARGSVIGMLGGLVIDTSGLATAVNSMHPPCNKEEYTPSCTTSAAFVTACRARRAVHFVSRVVSTAPTGGGCEMVPLPTDIYDKHLAAALAQKPDKDLAETQLLAALDKRPKKLFASLKVSDMQQADMFHECVRCTVRGSGTEFVNCWVCVPVVEEIARRHNITESPFLNTLHSKDLDMEQLMAALPKPTPLADDPSPPQQLQQQQQQQQPATPKVKRVRSS